MDAYFGMPGVLLSVYVHICSFRSGISNFVLLPFLFQRTPLHVAAEGARVKVVEYLVDQGADINIKDNDGVNE